MSTGVIGGADGPTAIFISGGAGFIWVILGAIVAVAAIAGIIGFLISRK